MQLKQLVFLREIVDNGFSVSVAANALHTSQPSVSRQVQALEEELGVTVFVRGKKRFLGLTKSGAEVVRIALDITIPPPLPRNKRIAQKLELLIDQ